MMMDTVQLLKIYASLLEDGCDPKSVAAAMRLEIKRREEQDENESQEKG